MSCHCESCGMSIASGPYCTYCTTPEGALQGFEERLERMKAWARKQSPQRDEAAVERQTLEYMSSMPAWKQHPDLLARLR